MIVCPVRHCLGSIERSPDRPCGFPVPELTVRAALESTYWPGGRWAVERAPTRVAKRTLCCKGGTTWPQSGMRSLDSFERLWFRLHGSISAVTPSLMFQRFRVQLRILETGPAPLALTSAPNTCILGIFAHLRRRSSTQGSIPAPAPIKLTRRLRAKCFGSCGSVRL